MKNILEYVFYLGGSLVLWWQVGSALMSIGLLIYGCYRFNRFLTRIRLLRSFSACQ